jgi:hypothetical protein
MKSIKLYFAGEWGPRAEQGDLDIKNRLVSYLYPMQLTKWLELTRGKPGNIILDSGAFSAWNKGKKIDLDDYIAYAHHAMRRAEKSGKTLRVVNLDVIPGSVGKTKTLAKDVREAAAMQGYKNLLRMKDKGITPIHVFHQGEDFEWLHKMVALTDYIGISPANDVTNQSRAAWLYETFTRIKKERIEVDTHGFAVFMPSMLRDLPWTSADAISWLMIAANGSIIYPVGGFTNFNYSLYNKPFNQFLVSEKQIAKGEKHLTSNLLKLIEEDGYTYTQLQDYKVREEINVRTFHLFEKWLNTYKQKTEYEPTPHLF